MKIFLLFGISLIFLFNYCESITLECSYSSCHPYCCRVQNYELITSKDNREITAIEGEHEHGHTSDDVQFFLSYNKRVSFFPREITQFFKNIEHVRVEECRLQEITKHDLKQFGDKLKILDLTLNELQVIEGDLFEFNVNLVKIVLDLNKIKQVGNGAFGGLNGLNILWFQSAKQCVNFKANSRENVLAQLPSVDERCRRRY